MQAFTFFGYAGIFASQTAATNPMAMTENTSTPTLHDVAKRANVSTATVSRCLNSPDQVSEKTRQKVMHAVEHLGYSPNFGARVMASQRTNTIGAIIPTMDNAVFARGLQAFQEELDANGYTLLVASASYSAELETAQIRSLVARGADALLLIGHDRDPAIYRFLEAQNLPCLVTWAFDDQAGRPSIGFDNRAAMRTLAREILGLGHRHIGFISAPTATNDRARARLHGLIDEMNAAGLDPNTLRIIETPYSIENGARAFDQMMQRQTAPTAVFCGNDVLAVGAINGARKLGLDVPNDVTIAGFDDIELAQVTYPTLTTVHVPHRQMGQEAARALIAALRTGERIAPRELATQLRLRGSHGPATSARP